MSGFNGISEQENGDLLGQLALVRLHLQQLIDLKAPVSIAVQVRLHLALDHVDDAIRKHEEWEQTRAIQAASANVRRIAV
jgi:hypothetical protein